MHIHLGIEHPLSQRFLQRPEQSCLIKDRQRPAHRVRNEPGLSHEPVLVHGSGAQSPKLLANDIVHIRGGPI
jgi:hypothetical protein